MAGLTDAGALVIGCDTDVLLDGRLLGKPGDEGQAREYLERLSGRTHEVLSGLALVGPEAGQQRERRWPAPRSPSETRARRRSIAICARASGGERAGGYAIQGLGSTLVAAVEGDVSNVIGLPVALLLEPRPRARAHSADLPRAFPQNGGPRWFARLRAAFRPRSAIPGGPPGGQLSAGSGFRPHP